MVGKRGRKKRAEATPQHDSQELISSRASSRYITRSARGGVNECATLRNQVPRMGTTRTLTPARRVLKGLSSSGDKDNDNASQNSPPPPPQEPVIHSVSASSRTYSTDSTYCPPAPTSKLALGNVANIISKLNPQSDVPRQAVHHEPLKGSDVVREKITNNNSGRRSQTNITEFVQKLLEDVDDDPEEVQSALDPDFEYVNGRKLKRESAPLLISIFEKYGDITSETDVDSPNILSFFLERLCDIYRQLEGNTFSNISHIELKDMAAEVGYFETHKLNVGWLRNKLEYIYETKMNIPRYLSAKEKATNDELSMGRIEKELDTYETELSDLKKKICLVEEKKSAARDEWVATKANFDRNKELVQDIKDRLSTLKHSLVDGLL